VFSDQLETVKSELESIVDMIVRQSSNIPRPENSITKSDKQHLWDVQYDDELVINSKAKISETLSENLKIVELALEVYDDYLFILKEKDRIEAFLKKEPFDREAFQQEIDLYQATINKIREEMPFEIRMNMFLIKCSDINNALCEDCEELIKMILDKVGEYVFHHMAIKIQSDVKLIKDDLAQKASNSKLLVSFEARLENVKLIERKRLMDEYTDLVEWLMMLNKNPRYKLIEDNIKPVTQAYNYINDITFIIEASEQKLK